MKRAVVKEISNFSVRAPLAVAVDVQATFEVTADAGDFLQLLVDLGDGNVVYYSVRFHDNMPLVNHTYTVLGPNCVIFDLLNVLGMQSVFKNVFVAEPILNTSVSANHSKVGVDNQLNLTVTGGSHVTVTVVWGDDFASEVTVCNSTDLPGTFSHTYTVPGTWQVLVYVYNPLSSTVYNLTLGTDIHLQGLELVFEPRGTIGNLTSFSRFMVNGSQLTCVFDFGDDTEVNTTYEYAPLKADFLIEHNYTELGDYKFNYTCWNYLDVVTIEDFVYLHTEIVGVRGINVEDGGAYIIDKEQLIFLFEYDAGYPADFNFSIGGVEPNASFVTYDPYTANATWPPEAFPPGDYVLRVGATNFLSDVVVEYDISLDRVVVDVVSTMVMTSEPSYVAVGRDITVHVTQKNGSRVTDVISFGDSIFSYYYPENHNGTFERNDTVVFTHPGLTNVSVVVSNSVSNHSDVHLVTAEVPLDNVTLHVTCPCIDETVVTLTYVMSASLHVPNEVTAVLDFGDGTVYTGPMVMEGGNGSEGTWSITHDYAHHTTYTASLKVDNHVSHLHHIDLTVDVAEVISNQVTTIPFATQFGDVTSVHLTADSGTNITVVLDWGDGSDVTRYYETAGALSAVVEPHTYTAVGAYNVTVNVSNSKDTYLTHREVYVDVPITNYSRTALHVTTRGGVQWVNLTVATGTQMTLFFDPGDPGGVVYQSCPLTPGDLGPLPFTLPDWGVHSAWVFLSNSLNNVSDTFLLAVNQPLADYSFDAPSGDHYTGEPIVKSFIRRLSAGSHITCFIGFGDGEYIVSREVNASTLLTYNHSYTEIGAYEVTSECYNFNSHERTSSIYYVQNALTNYTWLDDVTWVLTSQTRVLQWSVASGTDVMAVVTYAPLRTDVAPFVTWNGRNGALTLPYPAYGLGPHDVNITLFNGISSVVNTLTVRSEAPLAGVEVAFPGPYLASDTEYHTNITGTSGTHVRWEADLGDGARQEGNLTNFIEVCPAGPPRVACGGDNVTQADCEAASCCYDDSDPALPACHLPDLRTGEWNRSVAHTYTIPGTYSSTVVATNDINTVVRVSHDLIVEHRVVNLELVDVDPKINFTLGIRLLVDPAPTDALIEVDFGDGSPNVTEPLTVGVGADHLVTHLLPTDDRYTATVVIYNNVSRVVLSHRLYPEQAVVNASVAVSPPRLPGDVHDVTVTYDGGHQVELGVDFGDGTPNVRYLVLHRSLLPALNHTYSGVGSYVVTVNLTNSVSHEVIRRIADVDLDIENVTLEVTHVRAVSGQPHPPALLHLQVGAGSRLHVLVTDTAYHAVYRTLATPAALTPITLDYTDLPRTVHYGIMEMFNTRSHFVKEFYVVIEKGFEDVVLEVSKEAVVFPTEALVFTLWGVGEGSTVVWDLGNGYNHTDLLNCVNCTYNYTYPDDGCYDWSISLNNHVDSYYNNGTVCVQAVLEGLVANESFSVVYGENITIYYTYTVGTSPQLLGLFGGNEVPVTDSGNKSGFVQLQESDYTVGTHLVRINLTNYVSSLEVNLTIDIDYIITDLVVTGSPDYIPVNGSVTIQAIIGAGTRMTWLFTYDDSTSETVDNTQIVASGVRTTSRDHTYSAPGYFNASVNVSNSVSFMVQTIAVGVEFAIDRRTNRLKYPAIDRTSLPFRLVVYTQDTFGFRPTGTEVSIDWGDGSSDDNIPVDLTTSLRSNSHTVSHFFTTYGWFPTTVVFFNNISSATYTLQAQVGRPIVQVTLGTPNRCVKHDDAVLFHLHVDRGSNVNYTLDYDDGTTPDWVIRQDPGDWYLPDNSTLTHVYGRSGYFTPVLVASNAFGSETVTLAFEIKVEYAILGTVIHPIDPISHPPGTTLFTISVNNSVDSSPTDVTCDFSYGDNHTERVAATFDGAKKFVHTYSYNAHEVSPGHYYPKANCSNCVSDEEYSTTVWLQQPIADITIVITDQCISAPGMGCFTLGIGNGSHLYVKVDFGDGEINDTMYFDSAPDLLIPMCHLYQDGNFSVVVTTHNEIGRQDTVAATKFISQDPIPELILTSNSPVVYPPGRGEFTIGIDAADQGPTDMFCKWTFFDGGTEHLTFAGPLHGGTPHTTTSGYGYGHVGAQVVNVNCSNCISWKAYNLTIEVSEGIQGFDVDISHRYAQVGTQITFTFTVTHGSNVSAEIQYGDGGAKETADFPRFIAKDQALVFTHNYTSPGYYLPHFTVVNGAGREELPQPAGSVEVGIEHPITDLQLAADNRTRPEEEMEFVLTQIQQDEPTSVRINWTYGDGQSHQEYLTLSADAVKIHRHLYYYQDYGDFIVTAMMGNNISSLTRSIAVRVGVEIEGVNLLIAKPDVKVDFEYAEFTSQVSQGSAVEYVVLYGDGAQSPATPRTDSGWTTSDATIIKYIYPQPGDYTVTLTATNTFSTITVPLGTLVNAEHQINTRNVTELATHPMPSGHVDFEITKQASVPAPTDATCDFDFGDGEVDTDVLMTFTGDLFTHHHQYEGIDPGEVNINITCSNKVSVQRYLTTLMLHEPISAITGDVTEKYLPAPSEGALWTNIKSGSHITYVVNFTDGFVNTTFITYPPKGNDSLNFTHIYQVGNYTATVSMSNDISSQQLTMPTEFVVQYVITPLLITTNSPVMYPPGLAEVQVRQAYPNLPPPTDVFCKWQFYPSDQFYTNYVGETFQHQLIHTEHYTYSYSKLGLRTLYLNCSNFVSYDYSVSTRIRIDENITGFSVRNSSMRAKTTDTVRWTYSVLTGTNILASLTVGSETFTKIWPAFYAVNDEVVFEKNGFDDHGNFTLLFQVSNSVAERVLAPADLLVVQRVITPFTVVADPGAACPPCTVTFTVELVSTTSPGTDPFIQWSSVDDGSEWETYSADLNQSLPHIESHTFGLNMVGRHPINVKVKNMVSELTSSVSILLQTRVENPLLERLNESVQVGAVAWFSVKLDKGSHVNFTIDYKDGSSETIAHPNLLNSTSPVEFSHRFMQRGNFSISVEACNDVNCKSVVTNNFTIVQTPVAMFDTSVTSFVAIPDGLATYTFTIPEHFPAPDNVFFECRFGDGTSRTAYNDGFRVDRTYTITHTFDGLKLGVIQTTCNASNFVNWTMLSFDVYVVERIENPNINLTTKFLPVNAIARSSSWVELGSDITYTVSYGDGTSQSCFQQNNTLPCEFEHPFTEAGNFTVNITAENPVGRIVKQSPQMFIVQEVIDINNLYLIHNEYIANPSGIFRWTLAVKSGRPAPTDVHLEIAYDDGETEQLYIPSFPFEGTHRYSSDPEDKDLGDKNIELNLTNIVSNATMRYTIQLQEPVTSMTIHNDPFVPVGENTTITLVFESGSHLRVVIRFGDDSRDSVTIDDIVREVNFTTAYSSAGPYNLTVLYENQITENVVHKLRALVAQHPVQGIELLVKSPIKIAGNSSRSSEWANIMLKKGQDTPTLSDTDITVSFGDGQEMSEVGTVDPEYSVQHQYMSPGTYTVEVTIENGISSRTLRANLTAMQEVLGCRFTATSRESLAVPPHRFPVRTDVIMTAFRSSGTNLNYTWTPEAGVSWMTNVTETTYRFTRVGITPVQLMCWNEVSYQIVRQNLDIFSPLGIGWVSYERSVKVNTNVSLGIGLTTPIESICFSYEFKSENSSFTFWRGVSKEVCSVDEDFREDAYEPVIYTEETYWTSRVFSKIAEYNISFTAFNQFAKSTMVLPLSVKAVACNPPSISANGIGASVNDTIKVKRSQEFSIKSSQFSITKNCRETDLYINRWEVYSLREDQWVRQEGISNALGTGDDVKSFVFLKQTLPYGLFYVEYTLQPKGFPQLKNSGRIYFQVQGTLMTSCINNASQETVGSNSTYVLSTEDCTYDPDNDPRPFGYEWYCGRKSEMMNKTTGELDQHVIRLPTGVPQTEVPPDQAGCFGSGPGRLDVDGRSASIAVSTAWMAPNVTYLVLVRVSKAHRAITETLLLTVVQGDPRTLIVSCDESAGNCERNGQKVNTEKDFRLTMLCENCAEGVVPTLNIRIVRNGVPLELPSDSSTLTLLPDGKTLVFSQSLKNLTNPGWYEVEVEVKVDGESDGFSAFRFAVNRAPHGGGLRVTPEETAPLQPIRVEAYGWQDDGDEVETVDLDQPARRRRDVSTANHPDLTFTFLYIVKDVETPFFTDTPILPEGDPDNDYLITIRVQVRDAYGAVYNHSKDIRSAKAVYSDPEAAARAEREEEERLDAILLTDLAQSTDVLGDLSNVITAINVVSGEGDGEEDGPESGEEARLAAIKEQQRLESIMDGLVALASAQTTDADTIEATFKAFTAVARKQNGEASVGMKSNSLAFLSTYLDQLGGDPEALTAYVGVVGDTLRGVLEPAVPPPPLTPEGVAPEDEDEADLRAEEEAQNEANSDVAREAATVLEDAVKMAWNATKDGLSANGDTMVIGNDLLTITFSRVTADTLNGTTLEPGVGELILPPMDPKDLSADDSFFLLMTFTRSNPFSWVPSSSQITDGVTTLDMVNQRGEPVQFNITRPLLITMPQTKASDNWANTNNATVDQESSLVYFYVPVDVDVSAYVMELRIGQPNSLLYFQVFFTFGATDVLMDRPNTTRGSYDWVTELPDPAMANPWILVVPESLVKPPGIYIGILPRVRDSSILFNQSGLPPFNMRSSLPRCRAWDNVEEIWSGKNCKVRPDSTIEKTRCSCGTLNRQVRTYSGGISVPKVNTIDFSAVFANFAALLLANTVTLATTLTITVLYLLLLVWARKADRRDQEKWTVTPLVDNPIGCPHMYKVSVYTGLRQGAGTLSKVCFILSGENGDTGVRIMDDGRGKGFRRGTVHHFLMTTDQPLQDLTFIRVWHDNSGGGIKASWFLDKVVVEDLNQKQRYFFMCSRWLAVDEDDGQIDRVIPPAAREEIDSFNHVFFSQTRHKMTDDHLWISILSRPTRSTFTRAQRLTCCLSLLCTTMVANAMWYGTVEATENDTVIRIGPIILSVATLLVSIFSSLTVVPVNVLLVQLFRRSRPRHLSTLPDGSHLRTPQPTLDAYANKRKYAAEHAHKETEIKPEPEVGVKKGRKRFMFPWWCRVVAWVVALLSSVASLFFVVLYTLQWGLNKSEEWLSALALAFLQSVIVIQPLKVIVVAMAISLIFKKFDEEEDEEDVPVLPAPGGGPLEEYDEVMNIDRQMTSAVPLMPTKRKLEKARRAREHEKAMWAIILEVATYLVFLVLVAFIAWGTKDQTRFTHTDYIYRLLDGRTPRNLSESVWKVSDPGKLWYYMNTTVPLVLYNTRDYTGQLTKRQDRAFISDGTNLRVGAVRLRQLRVKPASCVPDDLVKGLVIECNVGYSVFDEENENFTAFWNWLPPNSSEPRGEVEEAFRYKGILELKGLPTWGQMATYGGGGYVADLGTSPNKARRVLQGLMDNTWIDYYTRAVFLEFTLYNANTNLFAYVSYLLELPPTGSVLPMTIIRSFPVYTVFSPIGTMVLIAQILYILILIYFIVRESRKLYRLSSSVYFADPWNIFEVVVIVTSVVGVAMFGVGEAAGRLITKEIHDNKKGYTHYQQFATYEETLTAVIGLIVFLSNVRFLRLLRFNDHVNDLISVFHEAGRELLYFGVTFCIVFFAFSMPAVTFFGRYMYSFSNIIRAVAGTFSIILGKMKWHDMVVASPVTAPIFFLGLMILVYFILINMSVSILNTAYEIVRLRPDRQKPSEYQVLAFIGSKISLLFGCSKVTTETGKDYVDTLDTLDNRLDHINNIINTYYRENIKLKDKKEETKEEKEGPGMKKNTWFWDNMVHF